MSSPAFAIPPDLTRDTGTMPGDGPIKLGSDDHKRLFCKTLLDTHDPYKPAVLDWPRLGDEAQKRITALPIWDIAVQTENRAGLIDHLPDGLSEIYCHPATGPYPGSAPGYQYQGELAALLEPGLKGRIAAQDIRLGGFADFPVQSSRGIGPSSA